MKKKDCMDKRNLDYILDYVETSHFSTGLFKVIEDYSEHYDALYRGILYPKEGIEVGHEYEHDYDVTSWSRNNEVAIDFALNKSISDRALTNRHIELSGEDKEIWELSEEQKQGLTKTFCPIVLVHRSGIGLCVNKYCQEHEYQNEEEVLVYQGKWRFTAVDRAETDEGKEYLLVTVEQE